MLNVAHFGSPRLDAAVLLALAFVKLLPRLFGSASCALYKHTCMHTYLHEDTIGLFTTCSVVLIVAGGRPPLAIVVAKKRMLGLVRVCFDISCTRERAACVYFYSAATRWSSHDGSVDRPAILPRSW